MTKVIGKIESLKALKNELNDRNITAFSSVAEINRFQREFENKIKSVLEDVENEIILEIRAYKTKIDSSKNDIQKLPSLLKQNIEDLETEINSLVKKRTNFITRHFVLYRLRKRESKRKYYIDNFDYVVADQKRVLENKIDSHYCKISSLTDNMEGVVKKRSKKRIKELNYIKDTIDELSPLIAGAIGENLVVKELSKLSDDYILINDFQLKFAPPIYNKKNNDRIGSVQIDHLLVSRSGIFLLETKNWSERSINSFDLRSPIDQISRTSYALFVFLNGSQNKELLNYHHWGEKKIPIKNLLVMINSKPKDEFKFVKVLKLQELNGYIEYFEPIFKNKEVENIASILNSYTE